MNDIEHIINSGRILGAVLAGGLSTRFGSDKAQALLRGRPLIDHAVASLALHCDAVIIVGREHRHYQKVSDWPAPHMGPLGGFAGALHHARQQGYAAVLTCGVDSIDLPPDLISLLGSAPAYLRSQPVIGLWPASAAIALEEILLGSQNHSVRHFAERIGARPVAATVDPINVNTQQDLDRIASQKL